MISVSRVVPTIHSSAVAELYTPPVFENKKSTAVIGFRKIICIFAENIYNNWFYDSFTCFEVVNLIVER